MIVVVVVVVVVVVDMITHWPCPFCPLYTQQISSHSAPEYQCEKSGSYYQTFSEKNVFILVAVSGIGDSCPILPYFSTETYFRLFVWRAPFNSS